MTVGGAALGHRVELFRMLMFSYLRITNILFFQSCSEKTTVENWNADFGGIITNTELQLEPKLDKVGLIFNRTIQVLLFFFKVYTFI